MKLAGLSGGLIAAILSSICCIAPAITLLAGTSSIAASVSWLEPARPYLAGFTVVILGLAWYQKLNLKRSSTECNCEEDAPSIPFWKTRSFLGIITVFALLMLSFPYYAHAFYPKQKDVFKITDNALLKRAEFKISGMTCASCEELVMYEVNKLEGIVSSKVSYASGIAIVEFDEQKIKVRDIEIAINSTGYKVVEILP